MIFAIGFIFYRARASRKGSSFRWIILIPVYKEDEVSIPTVVDLVQKTSSSPPKIVVLADGLKNVTLGEIERLGASYLEFKLDKSTKAKSLKLASEVFKKDGFDRVLILDADDQLASGAWEGILKAGELDCAVQRNRSALNTDTPMAYLDKLNEAIGISIFRAGHGALGIPSALTGSAMFFFLANIL